MNRRPLLLLALFFVLLCPVTVRAEYVILHNECRMSVVVQTASVVRGVLKRDQALVKPSESTAKIPLDSDKVITIYDGRTGRILFRDSLRASKKPLAYGIIPDHNAMKVRVAARALPTTPPVMPSP